MNIEKINLRKEEVWMGVKRKKKKKMNNILKKKMYILGFMDLRLLTRDNIKSNQIKTLEKPWKKEGPLQ